MGNPSRIYSRPPRHGRFWRAFVTGVASLTAFGVAPTQGIRYPHVSDAAALRSDWLRIGHDMQRVIDREHARVQEKS